LKTERLTVETRSLVQLPYVGTNLDAVTATYTGFR